MMESTSDQSVKIMECARKIMKNEILKRLKEKIHAKAVTKNQNCGINVKYESLTSSNKQLSALDLMGNETISIPSIEVFPITGDLPLKTVETLNGTGTHSVKVEPNSKLNIEFRDHQKTEANPPIFPIYDYLRMESSIKEEQVFNVSEFPLGDIVDSSSFSVNNDTELAPAKIENMGRLYQDINSPSEDDSTVQPAIGFSKECNKCNFKCATYRDLRVHTIVFHDQNYPHTCNLCKYVTDKRIALEKHIKEKHEEKIRYSCQQCERTFSFKFRLIQHAKIHEAEPETKIIRHQSSHVAYSCSLCDYTCKYLGQLKRHNEFLHDNVKNFICDLCDFSCNYSYKLTNHVRKVHTEPKSHVCKECDKQFKTGHRLNVHVRVVHRKIKNFSCDTCSFKTHQPAVLKAHVAKVHLKIKPHLCETCGKSYSCINYLKSHIEHVHKQIRSVICAECNQAFIRRDHLIKHMWKVHKMGNRPNHSEDSKAYNKPPPRECQYCHKTYAGKYNLQEHIKKVHEKLKPHQCPHCEFATAYAPNLSGHIKSQHENIYRHKCHLCDYGCSASFAMKRHIAVVHEKSTQRPYVCSLCDFSTFDKNYLLKHDKSVHRGCRTPQVKKFPCQLCGLKFRLISVLNTHISVVHEKLRPHKCVQCDRSFGQLGNLKSHIHTVHEQIHEFVCQSCDYSTSHRGNLKKHIARYHKKLDYCGDSSSTQESQGANTEDANTEEQVEQLDAFSGESKNGNTISGEDIL